MALLISKQQRHFDAHVKSGAERDCASASFWASRAVSGWLRGGVRMHGSVPDKAIKLVLELGLTFDQIWMKAGLLLGEAVNLTLQVGQALDQVRMKLFLPRSGFS